MNCFVDKREILFFSPAAEVCSAIDVERVTRDGLGVGQVHHGIGNVFHRRDAGPSARDSASGPWASCCAAAYPPRLAQRRSRECPSPANSIARCCVTVSDRPW